VSVAPASLPPQLIPAPARLELLPGEQVPTPAVIGAVGASIELLAQTIGRAARFALAADPWLACQVDGALGAREHYVLTVLPRQPGQPKAVLNASDEDGLRHGLHTLAQLLRQYGDGIPALRIEDRPSFARRGVMLDVSRDRVPTMAELEAIVDLLGSLKINHLQLYTEHAFAYRGHEAVWRDASPLTPDEVRALDRRCRTRGIELAANQNCFGHLHRWLKLPAYQALAEVTGDWDFNGHPRSGPFSLCPLDPGSLALVDDLVGQLAPCFASPLINVGCDETFDVGQGRSKAAVAARGRSTVYLEYLGKICAIARAHGKRPMFWADIALEHPEALAGLPDDLIALAWGYEPDSPFARWCSQLHAVGREVWVCPGTSSWRSITGRTTERRENLLGAARDGLANGASGWLVTDWGDLGHRQQWPVALNALVEAAHRAWSGVATYDPRAASLHAFGDRTLGIAGWLDQLGDADRALRLIGGKPGPGGEPKRLLNASALFVDLHKPIAEPWIGDYDDWRDLAARLARMQPPDWLTSGLEHRLWRECRHAQRVAEFAATRGACRRSKETTVAFHALAASFRDLVEEHRELWLGRSRPGGLEDSCAWYRATLAELERPHRW
jgi:hexosaminidase